MAMEYQWINSDAALASQSPALQAAPRLYIDTEFMRERTYFPALALVQINDGGQNLLLDPVPLQDRQALAQLLQRCPLVMHACSEDLQALKAWNGIRPAAVEDTQVAAALCGFDLQCSYQKLVQVLLDVSLPKDATRTDWLRRPLSEAQLEYAVLDVDHLPQMHALLVEKLTSLGRLAWWHEECQRLLEDAQREPLPEQLWRSVKGAGTLDGPQRARLQALAAWRDGCAQARDLPRSFVIKDVELLALVQRLPASTRQLDELGLHPSAVRKFGDQLLQILHAAEAAPEPAPLPGPPDAAQRATVKRLRGIINRQAEHLNVAPELLARRRWLDALVINPDEPVAAFSGWRHEVILKPLQEAL